MWVLLPCLALPFAYSVFAYYRNNKSIERQIELIKQLPSAEASADEETTAPIKDKKIVILRYALLTAGIAVMIYGLTTGGVADVLTKAVNICTECIGLG